MAFSGSLLLALTIFDLLPEVYQASDPKTTGIFILLGILLQIFLEFYSQGLEHGHNPHSSDNKWSRFLIFISLCTHALLEGIPLQDNHAMFVGILVHKIPVAIVLSIFLIHLNYKVLYSVGVILIFAIMTPLGSLLSENLPLLKSLQNQLQALVIGVFLHISTVILFESSKGHQFNIRKLLVIVLGIAVAYWL